MRCDAWGKRIGEHALSYMLGVSSLVVLALLPNVRPCRSLVCMHIHAECAAIPGVGQLLRYESWSCMPHDLACHSPPGF